MSLHPGLCTQLLSLLGGGKAKPCLFGLTGGFLLLLLGAALHHRLLVRLSSSQRILGTLDRGLLLKLLRLHSCLGTPLLTSESRLLGASGVCFTARSNTLDYCLQIHKFDICADV